MSDKILVAIIAVFVLVFVAGIVLLFISSGDQEEPADPEQELSATTPQPTEQEVISRIPGDPGTGTDPVEPAERGERETIVPDTITGALEGRVLDTRDAPVKGAWVYLYKSVPSFPVAKRRTTNMSAETDAKGHYHIASIPVDNGYALMVRSDGYATAEMDGLAVAPERTIRVADFRLDTGYSLTGTVTDPEGSTLTGVEVMAVDKMKEMAGLPPEAHTRSVTTDMDGNYLLTCLSQSQFEITFSAQGYRSITISQNFLLIGEPDKPQVRDVQLDPSGLQIKGVVQGAGERPIANAEVQALFTHVKDMAHFTAKTRTDKKGRFILSGFSEGNYTLRATAKGYFQAEYVSAAAGEERVGILMSPTGAVEGVVQAPGPVPKRYTVRIESYTPSIRLPGPNRVKEVRCGPKAQFKLTDLMPGKYVFLVMAGEYAQTRSDEVEVLAGETTGGVVVELLQGGTLKGEITDTRGKGLGGAKVELMDKLYEPSLPFEEFFKIPPEQGKKCVTAGSGAFVLEHIRAGEYSLKIDCKDKARKTVRQIVLAEGETLDLGKIKLSGGGGIKGTAYDENGAPSRGTKVTAVSQTTGNRKTVTTDNKGQYEIGNLAAGEYIVSLTLKDFWSALQYDTHVTAQVYENQTTRADIVTRPAERLNKNRKQ